MLATADRNGVCAMTVGGLAALARISRDEAVDAFNVLSASDPDTLTQEHEGRRIERVDGGWKLLNWEIYREKAKKAIIQEYNREAQARHREKENQKEKPDDEAKPPASRFTKPSPEELNLEAAKHGLPEAEIQKFVNYYESNGWRVGKNPMKSWTHALANWNTNYRSRTNEHKTSQSTGRSITGPDRNAGTANAQTIGQYDGVGKMVPVRDGGNS